MCGIDIDGDDLGQLVRMQCEDAFTQCIEMLARGFDDQQLLFVATESVLPAVSRDDAADAIDARGKVFFDECVGEAFAGRLVGTSAERYDRGHIG